MLPMMFALTAFVVNLIVMTVVFYVAGLIVVGGKRALLSDAFVISLLGTILGSICTLFIPLIGVVLSFIVWLLLIRHYYETGWLGALAVAILAVIVYVVVLFILAVFLAIPLLLFRGLTSLLRAVMIQGIF
ncbi:MAG: hypothetical protein ACE5OW_01695 [Candidatus Bathyarchaeia archaeon]